MRKFFASVPWLAVLALVFIAGAFSAAVFSTLALTVAFVGAAVVAAIARHAEVS